ncbi:hypothetical protein CFter6_2117 [Collimonas fungivorans]|uniref:Uncharacterized protein n=1 Tax=Collimonas fungivorans TaxID=158899 RepID=A0A127PAN1_9BURK|nr:hypothetical protein CFter6_2117 [Collimonas fungivorans]
MYSRFDCKAYLFVDMKMFYGILCIQGNEKRIHSIYLQQ